MGSGNVAIDSIAGNYTIPSLQALGYVPAPTALSNPILPWIIFTYYDCFIFMVI